MAWGQYRLFLFMSAALLLARVSVAQITGVERPIKWDPIKNFKEDPELHELAEFAVTEYSKKTGQSLLFHSIVSAAIENMGTWKAAHYRFVIAVENNGGCCWSLENYVAIVWGRVYRMGSHTLESFKRIDV